MCYRIFYDQVKNSKERRHAPPQYTKEELYEWMTTQTEFSTLYQEWVDSEFTSDFRPSCDRLDNTIGYTFDNIELVPFKVNKERAYRDTKAGLIGTGKKVYKYAPTGEFMSEFVSSVEAASSIAGADHRNIATACRGAIPSAYSFLWSYTYYEEGVSPVTLREKYDTTIYKYCAYTGDIKGIFENISEIVLNTNKQTNLRTAIRNETHFDFHYYSFQYLSPVDVIDRFGIPKQKHIRVYTIETLELIGTYASPAKGSKELGVSPSTFTRRCKDKKEHKGMYFRYIHEDDIKRKANAGMWKEHTEASK